MMAAANAGGAPGPSVADLFSTDIFTTNSQPRTVNNGIDLAGEGGMVWFKSRSNSSNHHVFDTERGSARYLSTDAPSGESTNSQSLTSFNSNGFSLGIANIVDNVGSAVTWTFRKAPQFFDVVTYTGNGTAGRTVTHNLGSVPGMIWIKRLDFRNWSVYHRAVDATAPEDFRLLLNEANARIDTATAFNDTAPTSTNFTLGTDADVNTSGQNYVAYVFAHEPAGNIQCGSYTGNGSSNGPIINLGWQPQFLLIKRATGANADWFIFDTTRGITSGSDAVLEANDVTSEASRTWADLTSTGFEITSSSGVINSVNDNYIYMAIRAE